MKKKEPPPFAALHHDYDESLTALLVAAGKLATQVHALLSLNQIPVAHCPSLARLLAEFNHAYYGDES